MSHVSISWPSPPSPVVAAKEHHGGEERAAEEPAAPVPGGAPLLLPDPRETLLRPRLRQRRRGKAYCHLLVHGGTRMYATLPVLTWMLTYIFLFYFYVFVP